MNPELTRNTLRVRVRVTKGEASQGSPNKATPGTGKKVAGKKSVTVRDRLVMEWIGINGVASLKQLQLVFWPEASESTCQRRLLPLEKEGWIKRHYVDTSRKKGEQVYSLTHSGARNHFDPATRHYLMIGLPALSTLKQQLTAQDTRIVLGQLLAAQGKHLHAWINEHELRGKALLSRRKGRKWANAGMVLADISDARVVIENQPDTAVPGLKGRLEDVPCANNSSFNKGEGVEASEADAGFEILEIEIDGQYYGQMLKIKIASLARRNKPTLWVTSSDRTLRVQDEIHRLGATNIQVLTVDPLLVDNRDDLPFGKEK